MVSSSLHTIDDFDLVSILPSSISDDVEVRAVAASVGEQINGLVSDIKAALPLMPNLDRLPERIVDLLAYDFHVDFYDPAEPIATKRERVRNAIRDHRIHGTKRAVQDILAVLFGEGNTEIIEWFENAGDPFTFIVETQGEFPEDVVSRLNHALSTTKSIRSWYTLKGKRSGELANHVGFGINQMVYHTSTLTN